MERIFRFCDAAVQGMVAYMCPAAVGTGSWRARFGRSSVRFGAPLVAFGLLLGLILVGCAPSSSGGASGNGANMPDGMTIDEAADCTVGTATACIFAVGDTFTGEVGSTDDPSDWVKVTLAADTSYRITATPDATGTTAELHIHTDGSTPETPADPDIGDDNLYTATTATVHYIEIGLDAAGGYELSIALAPEGENICNSMDAEGDCDGDNVSNDADTFPLNACATMDSDDDGHPDMIAPVNTPATCTGVARTALLSEMVGGIPLQEDNCATASNPDQLNSDAQHATPAQRDALGDACDPDDDGDNVLDHNALGIVDGTSMFNSMLVTADTPRDEFPLDASRSCAITTTNRASTTLNCDNDVDSSGAAIPNNADVDDDNDGLIELATETELNNIRNDLDGRHYDDGGSVNSNMGCPSGGCSGYELANDIALTASPGYANWVPVGSSSNPFTAIFEGNGYVIRDLAISSSSGNTIGIFHSVTLVRNLHIAGSISHSTTAATIGGIAAIDANIYNSGSAVSIESSSPAGTASGITGGLVGLHTSIPSIRNSWVSGGVTVSATSGNGYVLGGLVGSSTFPGDYTNVYTTGTIMGDNIGNTLGGLIGLTRLAAPLVNSYATGNVTGGSADDTIGGLVANSFTFDGFNISGIGAALTAASNNYHSGTVTGGGGSDTTYTSPGISAQTLSALQGCGTAGARLSDAASTLVCTGIYTGWAATDWDFGTASQLPVLKFAEHSTGQSPDSDCTPTTATGSTFDALPLRPGALAQPYCGKLLPCQRVSSTDTAEMTRCGL